MRRWLRSIVFGDAAKDAEETPSTTPEKEEEWCWLGLEQTEETARRVRDTQRREASRVCRKARSRELSIRGAKLELVDSAERLIEEDLSPRERNALAVAKLDAPRRSKVVGDAVRAHSAEIRTLVDRWVSEQGDRLSPRSKREAEAMLQAWQEEQWAKNVVGEAISMAFQASAAAEGQGGLTARVAAETAWAVQQSLLAACSQFSSGDLRRRVAESVKCRILPTLVSLWAKTEKASRMGSLRSGLVVERWRREEEEKRQREEGRVPDAKFEVVPYQRSSSGDGAAAKDSSSNKTFRGLRDKIAKTLFFHAQKTNKKAFN